MRLYPNKYIDKITDIDINLLKKNDIKGLLIDVDNTLLDYNRNIIEGAKVWAENLKKEKIKLCIVSNSNHLDKVQKASKELGDIKYVNLAFKPLKRGYKKGAKLLDLPYKNIGVVGDQIFTDIYGANRMKMFSILVKPLNEKDLFLTKIKRPFEKRVLEKYMKKEGK